MYNAQYLFSETVSSKKRSQITSKKIRYHYELIYLVNATTLAISTASHYGEEISFLSSILCHGLT